MERSKLSSLWLIAKSALPIAITISAIDGRFFDIVLNDFIYIFNKVSAILLKKYQGKIQYFIFDRGYDMVIRIFLEFLAAKIPVRWAVATQALSGRMSRSF
jgi:hypothetical protein